MPLSSEFISFHIAISPQLWNDPCLKYKRYSQSPDRLVRQFNTGVREDDEVRDEQEV
jgi:hypothetical protein